MAAVTSQWRGLLAVLSSTGARLDSAMTSHGAANTAAASPPAGGTRNCSYNSNLVLVFFIPQQDCLLIKGRPSANRIQWVWRPLWIQRHLFCSRDLDLEPMTSIYQRDLDIPNLHTKSGLFRSRYSKFWAWTRYTWPWHWPNDLNKLKWPRYILKMHLQFAHQKRTFYVKAFKSYSNTDRQTDTRLKTQPRRIRRQQINNMFCFSHSIQHLMSPAILAAFASAATFAATQYQHNATIIHYRPCDLDIKDQKQRRRHQSLFWIGHCYWTAYCGKATGVRG